jgi:hypothetical protein
LRPKKPFGLRAGLSAADVVHVIEKRRRATTSVPRRPVRPLAVPGRSGATR